MGLIAKKTGSDIKPVEEGVCIAICYALYDLGTHHDDRWNKSSHKVLVCWEIPDQRMHIERDGKQVDLPRAISQKYTLSLHDKASLRKDLEAWRSKQFTPEELKGFDLRAILGKACQIQVVHKKVEDRVYANIAAVMGLPKGMKPPVAENPLTFFSFEDSGEPPENTPEWIVELISDSEESKALARLANGEADEMPPENGEQWGDPEDNDPIPF